MKIQFRGLVAALFVGFLVSALFHLSTAWCVVIGIGAVPAISVVLLALIKVLDGPSIRLERAYYARKRKKNRQKEQQRIDTMRAKRDRS